MTTSETRRIAMPTPTRERISAYARASNDMNPLHLDQAAARQAGFDDVIAHGMLVMGLALSTLRQAAAAQRITTSAVRFLAPIPADASLSLLLSDNETAAEFTVVDAEGAEKISGQVTFS